MTDKKLYDALYQEALKTSCKESVDDWVSSKASVNHKSLISLIGLTSSGLVEKQMLDWGYKETDREYWQAKYFIGVLVGRRIDEVTYSVENNTKDKDTVKYFQSTTDLYKNRYGFQWDDTLKGLMSEYGFTNSKEGIYKNGKLVLKTSGSLSTSIREKWLFLQRIRQEQGIQL